MSANLKIGESEESTFFFFGIRNKPMNDESQKKLIGDTERELFRDIPELGRRLLQEHAEKRGDGDAGKSVIREDGQRLSHKRSRDKQPETLFGRIGTERMGYGYPEEAGIFPKDGGPGLPEKIYSYPVQKSVCREAVSGSCDGTADTLSEYTGAHVPERQCAGIVSDAAEDADMFYKQRSGKESEAENIVLSADGKGTVMRPEGLREKTRERAASQKLSKRVSKGEKRNRKREAAAATVYNTESRIRSVDNVTEELDREEEEKKRKMKFFRRCRKKV